MDFEQLSLPSNKKFIAKPKTKSRFLKGPIPLPWLQCAAQLPGKALNVGIVIWYLAGIKRSKTIQFSYKIAGQFGTNRYAAYRGLRALDNAGLIKMHKGQGRTPRIFIENQEPEVVDQ